MPRDRDTDQRHVARTNVERVHPADLFDHWVSAEAEAAFALAAWNSAASNTKVDAHAAYVAALDREAIAALRFQERCTLQGF
jgi:hypothetical protein